MPVHMPVLVDFWAVGSGTSTGQSEIAVVWMELASFYGADPTITSFSVAAKYGDGNPCNMVFTRNDLEGRITQQITPSAL